MKMIAMNIAENEFEDMDKDAEINAFLKEKTIDAKDEKNNDALNKMNDESDAEDKSSAKELIEEDYKNDANNEDSLERDMLEELEKAQHQNGIMLFQMEQVEAENEEL